MMKKLPKFFMVLAFVMMTVGCGLGTAPKGRKPSPDWSRGVPLAESIGGAVTMAVAGEGEQIHFAWPTIVDDETIIHYLRLDNTAVPLIDQPLNLPSGRLRSPQLLLTDDGQPHLFWVYRPPTSPGWALWHALLDELGQPLNPAQLSSTTMNVSDYAVASNNAGHSLVVWEDNESDALYGQRLTETAVVPEPVLLVASGELPIIQADASGTFHMGWVQAGHVYYEAIADGDLSTLTGTRITDLEVKQGDLLDGPVIGLTEEWGYIAWSLYSQTGLESDTGHTRVVSFPLDNPGPSAYTRLGLLTMEELPYQPYQSAYTLTQLAAPSTSPGLNSEYTVDPYTAVGREDELVLVVSTRQQIRLDRYVQMAVVVLADGVFQGYQMAAKTETFSQKGLLAADANGSLHLAWREGAGGRHLYYATTAPTTRAILDELDEEDFVNAFLTGAIEGLTGVAFFPFAILWLLPGGILLGIRQLRRDDENLSQTASQVLLVISLVFYQGMKLIVLPTFVTYVPFSAWLEIPESWHLPLRVAMPVLFLGTGILVAEWVRRRRVVISTLFYFFLVTATDAVLTLAVYGVAFLGVF